MRCLTFARGQPGNFLGEHDSTDVGVRSCDLSPRGHCETGVQVPTVDDAHLQGRLVGFLAPDMGTPTRGLYSTLSDLEPVMVSLNTENVVDIIIC